MMPRGVTNVIRFSEVWCDDFDSFGTGGAEDDPFSTGGC